MKFGLQLPGTFSTKQLMAIAATAETAGFCQVTLQDNVLMPSPWPLLGAMALSTQSIAIGPAVSNPVLVHPLELARQAARLQELAPGRVVVGLGRGSLLSVIGAKPQASFQQLKDALLLLKTCFGPADSNFDGATFSLSSTPPRRFKLDASSTRILVGGHGPKAAQLAGELADGLMVAGLWKAHYASVLRSILDAASQQAGHQQRPMLIAAPWTVLEPDPAKAAQLARATLARSLPFIKRMAVQIGIQEGSIDRVAEALREGDLKRAAELVPEEALDSLVATEHTLCSRIGEMADAGVDMVVFAGPFSEKPEDIVARLIPLLSASG